MTLFKKECGLGLINLNVLLESINSALLGLKPYYLEMKGIQMAKFHLLLVFLSAITVLPLSSCTPEKEAAASQTASRSERRFTDEQAAERLARIRADIAAMNANYKAAKRKLDEIITVKLAIDRELLIPGEAVTITIEAITSNVPNADLTITHNHLSESPETVPLTLQWQKISETTYHTSLTWMPPTTGSYLAHWVCNVGGDIPEFWRYFAVIDNSWTVQLINTNANGNHPPEEHLHKYRIPSNLFDGWRLATPPAADNPWGFSNPSLASRQYGDDYMPSLWLSSTWSTQFGDHEEAKLYEEHKEVQEAVFEGYFRFLELAGFWRNQQSVMPCAMSNEVLDSAQKAGFTIIGGLYADQNWADGGDYRISHWGMPARPFFMAGEDFRKTQFLGTSPTIGIQQCHRQSVLCRDYNCVFSLEAGADYMMDRYSQYHKPRIITDVICSREYDLLRCFYDTQYPRKNPLFFTCCLEFAGFDWMPEMWQIQPLFIDYIARQAGKSKLVFVTPHGLADFYRRHYKENPESVLYLPDMWAGRVETGYNRPKPPIYPDTMEIENAVFRAILRKGETLPYVYYDYTADWNYPFWDDISPRKPSGYVVPNIEARFETLPPIFDTRSMTAGSQMIDHSDGTRIVIDIDSKVDKPDMAVAIWDIPRTYTEEASQIKLVGAKRFIPVQTPFTENLCGIVIADIQKGKNEIAVMVSSSPRPVRKIDIRIGKESFAKVFERDGGAIAYIYNAGKSVETLSISLSQEQTARLYLHASKDDDPIELSGTMAFELAPQEPIKIEGLGVEAIKAAFKDSEYVDITVKTPYCQIQDCGL